MRHDADVIEIRRLEPHATLPTRAHADDAGLDLYSLEDSELAPGAGATVKTGVAVAVPAGHVGLVADRSSMARRGLKTAGGVIDAGYRGELGVVLWNISREPQAIKKGERIGQLLIVPIAVPAVKEVDGHAPTARGAKGFGSTGR
ncbi:MAG TPA: dUTP diphosphatase [Elusimicrobiota bacterium]|jgi:dUTP pyrophosphatase|nr:dUTP diphosphatase [Elusimicrobiota bacterium]